MIRTQVFLREDQKRRAETLAHASGSTVSELVRIGLDWELDRTERMAKIGKALEQTRGALPDFKTIDRSEWDRPL